MHNSHPSPRKSRPLEKSGSNNRDFQVWNLGPKDVPFDAGLWMSLSYTMVHTLDTILEPYGSNINRLFGQITHELGSGSSQIWTFIFFEREVPLVEHFALVRPNAALHKGILYMLRDNTNAIGYTPQLGGLLLLDKESFVPRTKNDDLISYLYPMVSALPADKRWAVLAPLPDAEWIDARATCYSMKEGKNWFGYYYREHFSWSSDPGLRLLHKAYYSYVYAEDRWSMVKASGFIYWAGKQHIVVETCSGIIRHELMEYRVIAVSNLVTNVKDSGERILQMLETLKEELSGTSALIYYPDNSNIQLCSSCLVNTNNEEWIGEDFRAALTLLIIDAARFIERLKKLFGGAPLPLRHPVSGIRFSPESKIAKNYKLYQTTQGEANAWFYPDILIGLIDFLQVGKIISEWTPRGIKAQIPFNQTDNAYLEVSCISHEILGEGCQLQLLTPVIDSRERIRLMANLLNIQEFNGMSGVPFFGSWHCVPLSGGRLGQLIFKTFLPNLLFAHGRLENYAYQFVQRSKWLGNVLPSAIADLKKLMHEEYPREHDLSDKIRRVAEATVYPYPSPYRKLPQPEASWIKPSVEIKAAPEEGDQART